MDYNFREEEQKPAVPTLQFTKVGKVTDARDETSAPKTYCACTKLS